jgi:methylmalonyl-CoA/ethylmalonyl-CoA epimerase
MKRIEHIGIAVADLRAAEQIFEDVLGESAFKREQVESEGVEVSFFQTGESKVELLASTTPEGPIGQHIAKRGEGLHHLAFSVDDLRGEIERLQSLGYRVISGPKDGADNKEIAFLHPGDTNRVLVELCAERI